MGGESEKVDFLASCNSELGQFVFLASETPAVAMGSRSKSIQPLQPSPWLQNKIECAVCFQPHRRQNGEKRRGGRAGAERPTSNDDRQRTDGERLERKYENSMNRTRSGTLTGPRPPTARRPTPVYDSSGEDDEEQRIEAAEEGNGFGTSYGSDGGEKMYKPSPTLAKSNGTAAGAELNGNGVGKESTEWEELVAKMRDVARRWKKLLDKQGLSLYALSLLVPVDPRSFPR